MPRPKILIVEDDQDTCRELTGTLQDEFELVLAGDRAQALSVVRRERPHVVMLDLGLPPRPEEPDEGLRFLEDLRSYGNDTKVIVCTGYGQRQHALHAISCGAHDFLVKPVDLDALRILLRRACWISELEREITRLRQEAKPQTEEMIGASEAIRHVFVAVRKVATTEVPVLIIGESGTGKELAAKAIHERSRRSSGPFVTINCGAIPENLLEAELFGHEKGAFTGAVQARKGKVEYARAGTLFLDEIGELSLTLQVKLLRFLQDHAIERVGGRVRIDVDARIIAATHVDLQKAIERGVFREDLYYRLGVITLKMPPLRDRAEDAVLIALVFLKRVSEHMGKRIRGFSKEALRAIQSYPWPGNVRELSNKVRRAVAMAEGPYITPEDLDLPSDAAAAASMPLSLKAARESLEARMVTQSMARYGGNLSRVAEELAISRPTLYNLIRRYKVREQHTA